MQDVVSTGQQSDVTKTCLFINERAFLYNLADLQCRCYVHLATAQVYERFQSKHFNRITEIISVHFLLILCLTIPEAK